MANFSGTALADTRGISLLCAACMPGHASVSGQCIPCETTQYGAVLGVLVLALLLVYLVHRLPHDWTGSATLLIATYFLLQSVLFLAAGSLPQLLSLVNMNLLGDHASRGGGAGSDGVLDGITAVCLTPLDDVGRIVLALLSPLVAFALLAVVALLNAAAFAVLSLSASAAADNDYTLARRVYRWGFVPATPKLLPFGEVPAVSSGVTMIEPLTSGADGDSALHDRSEQLFGRSPASPTFPWRSYQRTSIRLLLLSYTSLSVTTLSFFHLQSVGEYGQRVMDYPTLSAGSVEYRALLPVIVCVLALVCGVPVGMAVWLWLEHRRGGIDEAKQLQRQGESEGTTRRRAVVLQLCAAYRRQHWWMPSFVLVRRLLLVSLLVFVRDSTVWTWLTLVNNCLLALHLKLEPYERRMDNTLEALTLLSLSVQTTLLSVWPAPNHSRALVGAFSTLVIAPLVPLAVATLSTCWWERRAKRDRSRLVQGEHEQWNEQDEGAVDDQ